jgi:hypothetical protein
MQKTAKSGSIFSANQHLFNNMFWKEEYLRKPYSFYEIVAGVAAIGRSISDPQVVAMLKEIFERKTAFTATLNAWTQYEHLAQWLVYIGSILEIRGTALETIFLDAVVQSMNTMGSNNVKGYSWHAYNSWNIGWSNVISGNRVLIRNYCAGKLNRTDAQVLIARP